jgi:RNA polymerase sigma factor (sigma-70 family)
MTIAKPKTRQELFIHLYTSAFPKVASFVRKMGGDLEEAKDIFQDALVIYYEKKIVPTLAETSNEAHYINGIAKHLWYKKYRENKMHTSLSLLHELKAEEENQQVSDKLFQFIEVAGKKCLELLKAFYYDKMNMTELSEKFGFSGERSATTQKFKCLEKVRSTVKQKALNKEDFYD